MYVYRQSGTSCMYIDKVESEKCQIKCQHCSSFIWEIAFLKVQLCNARSVKKSRLLYIEAAISIFE